MEVDEKLWFMHLGCEGKHYLIGNPQTFRGRMWAWCPAKQRTFFVSKKEMGEMSEQSRYWIEGFLHGNQPDPPTDEQGDRLFEGPEYEYWQKSVAHFHQTGFWSADPERTCESCGTKMLPSQAGSLCLACEKK